MAEFAAENCGVSSPSAGGKSAQPGDDADGRAASEVSVSNGNCGPCAPENQGLETANASVVLDGKTGIQRKTSIIKVKTINASAFFSFVDSFGVKPRPHTRLHPQVWGLYVCIEITPHREHVVAVSSRSDHVFFKSVSWFHDVHQSRWSHVCFFYINSFPFH